MDRPVDSQRKRGDINHLAIHQRLCFGIGDSQQATSPIAFLFLKLPPCPVVVLQLVFLYAVCTSRLQVKHLWICARNISSSQSLVHRVFKKVIPKKSRNCWSKPEDTRKAPGVWWENESRTPSVGESDFEETATLRLYALEAAKKDRDAGRKDEAMDISVDPC